MNKSNRPLISWYEIRERASRFAHEWENENKESGGYQSFWDEFFNIFGIKRRSVAVYQQKVSLLSGSSGYIDLFWPGVLLAEHKSIGQDLNAAFTQATNYFAGIEEYNKPQYVIVTDYRKLRLYDLESSDPSEFIEFTLVDLPKYVRIFDFIAGYKVRKFKEENRISVKAVREIGKLYEALVKSHYPSDSTSKLLTRLVFCFFADDVGIFKRDTLKLYLEEKTKEDGSDLGMHISLVFEVLNTPIEDRQSTLDEDLQTLPYVNGWLFSDHLQMLSGTSYMREILLKAVSFDWSSVSPAIFGSMFQSVMNDEERHDLGAHYTSEKNILKVISGLFLDDLYNDLRLAGKNTQKLDELNIKLSRIKILDPACGCGNFLVVAYRELRKLELEIIKRKYHKIVDRTHRGETMLDFGLEVESISKLTLENMYGIEIEEFPVQIAQLSLWLTDHLANIELGNYFGTPYQKLPLREHPNIIRDNALTYDWENLVDSQGLTYILGNPPFIGARVMSDEQRKEVISLFGNRSGGGNLDYVSGWYLKASTYIQGTNIECAFVSTNSIVQGEQVGILWKELVLNGNIKINFAHRTFKWNNEAPGNAAVYCVIIGFSKHARGSLRIYDYESITGEPHEIEVKHINPYLIDAPDIFIESRSKALNTDLEAVFGSMPNEGGYLLFKDKNEVDEFLISEPNARRFIYPFVGAKEFLQGGQRYCLWLKNASPTEINSMRVVKSRLSKIKEIRLKSDRKATNDLASTPYLFGEDRQPDGDYVLIPRVSSEKRRYIPMGIFGKKHIAGDTCIVVPNASLYELGILESEMHMEWMRLTAGRLKSDYRYSKDIVFNNFPWPENVSKEKKIQVESCMGKVIEARSLYPFESLANLYNSETMPRSLIEAHRRLDRAVDDCYNKKRFSSAAERLEFLFGLYLRLINYPEKLTKGNIVNENL